MSDIELSKRLSSVNETSSKSSRVGSQGWSGTSSRVGSKTGSSITSPVKPSSRTSVDRNLESDQIGESDVVSEDNGLVMSPLSPVQSNSSVSLQWVILAVLNEFYSSAILDNVKISISNE